MTPTLLIDSKNGLGEGVQWSVSQQRLFWVDIDEARLCSCDEFGQDFRAVDMPERMCSFAFDLDGNLLCAFASGLYRYNVETDVRDILFAFEEDKPQTRMNDGRCDRQGRFIVGGYNEKGPEAISSVISYDKGKATTLIHDVKCANSLSFSPDGSMMYFTDTATKKIFRFDYDEGVLSNRTLFADVVDDGSPDGSCVDADGALWNARFRGANVQRYLPDGTVDTRIELPVPNITCVCFGGKNLDKLYITTARHKMTKDQIAEFPLSGGVFVVEPGVTGLAEEVYGDHLF